MSGDVRGAQVELTALGELSKRVKQRIEDRKAVLAEAMRPGERAVAALGDGTVVGAVTYVKGHPTAHVTDDRALLAWVKANAPDEVVEQVNPAYVAALVKAAKDGGVACDPHTGAIADGITVSWTDPYLTAKADPEGLPALLDAIRAGQLLALDGDTEEEQ